MALPLVLIDGDSHAHPDGVEIAWTDLLEADCSGIATFINSASPGATMVGNGLPDIQERVLDHLIANADAPVKIVFNGFLANDIYGAFARTAAQCRDLCVQWAEDVRTVAPDAKLVCQTVTKKGGSATPEANTEAEAFSALCFSDSEVPGTPNYITWGYAACAPRRERIPNEATDTTVFEVDESHLNNEGESREYYGHNGYEGNQFIFWRLGITGITNMGTLSTYTLNGALEHVLGVSTFAPAATHYLAAFVAGTEVTGGAYARKAVTNNATNWPAAAARAKSLGVEQAFVTASGANWGAIDEIRIFDASSGGNELARDALASAVTIDDGETLVIEAGAIDITAAAGALSDDLAEAILDHVFGSVDITPEATVQFAYFDGDPQGAGVEITGTSYARIVHDNDDVTWSAASAGVVRNLIDFSFPTAGAADWDTADYWALFDAAGTGLMFSAALPAARAVGNGETETIQANRIRLTFS